MQQHYNINDIEVIEDFRQAGAHLVPMTRNRNGQKHPPKGFNWSSQNRKIESTAELAAYIAGGYLIGLIPSTVNMVVADVDLPIPLTDKGLASSGARTIDGYITYTKLRWKEICKHQPTEAVNIMARIVKAAKIPPYFNQLSQSQTGLHAYYRYSGPDPDRNAGNQHIEVLSVRKVVTLPAWHGLDGFLTSTPAADYEAIETEWLGVAATLDGLGAEDEYDFSHIPDYDAYVSKSNYAGRSKSNALWLHAVEAIRNGDEQELWKAVADAQAGGLSQQKIKAQLNGAEAFAKRNPKISKTQSYYNKIVARKGE